MHNTNPLDYVNVNELAQAYDPPSPPAGKVLPFSPKSRRDGPWIRQSSLSRGANRLCSVLACYVLQVGSKTGATRAFGSINKLLELMNRHRPHDGRPISRRTVERYLSEAMKPRAELGGVGFITRESGNRRKSRRRKTQGGVWLRLNMPDHDLGHDAAQPVESIEFAGENGGNGPLPQYGGFEPSEMADSVPKNGGFGPTLRDQERDQEEERDTLSNGEAKLRGNREETCTPTAFEWLRSLPEEYQNEINETLVRIGETYPSGELSIEQEEIILDRLNEDYTDDTILEACQRWNFREPEREGKGDVYLVGICQQIERESDFHAYDSAELAEANVGARVS